MPRSQPHPDALFSLKPYNERAEKVVSHEFNKHLVSILPKDENQTRVLDVGFNIRSKSTSTLATLGRGSDTDIYVGGSTIAKVQCSFEVDLDSGVIMLYDRSNGLTTQVSGENATPFEYGRLRRVVVQKGLNPIIGMGGVQCDLVQFQLIWHSKPVDMFEKIKSHECVPSGPDENPRFARTVDEEPTALPSQRMTRIHTAGERKLRLRYERVGPPLGKGQYGTVHKCVDVDSGKLMAMKVLERPSRKSEEDWRKEMHRTLKREVETLSEISHPHIIDYLASQGWDGQKVEIFMDLMEGTLQSMVNSEKCRPESVADALLSQMLQALDFLAYKDIVHRDVKPDNILYFTRADGQPQFKLGDFGFCNRVLDAATFAGSRMYMAPEMFRFTTEAQSSKLDVWSLFVTILWTLDILGFRQKNNQFETDKDVRDAIIAASKIDTVSQITEMAVDDPNERASAAQMLVKLYNGVGLSTPRNQVPAPINSPPAPGTIGKVLTPARTTQNRQRGFQRSRITSAAAAPYCIEKACSPISAQQTRWLQNLHSIVDRG